MRGDPFGEFQRDKNLLKKPWCPGESLRPYFYTLRLVKNPNRNLDNSQQVLVHQRLSWRCTQAVRFFSSGCGKSVCHCCLNVGSSSHIQAVASLPPTVRFRNYYGRHNFLGKSQLGSQSQKLKPSLPTKLCEFPRLQYRQGL